MIAEKKTRISRFALITIAGLLLVGFLVYRFGPNGGEASEAKSHSSTIKATNNASRTASVVSGEGQPIDLQSIAVINRSDHPVMRAVAQRLAGDLRARGMTDAVGLYDFPAPGAMPETGGELPSIFVMLDLIRFDETGSLRKGRTVDATLSAIIGPDLWDSRHGYADQLIPPYVQATAAITIEHHSVTTGSEAPNAKHAQLIDNLAAQASDEINGQLAEWAAKYERMTTSPVDLIPSYRPVPDDLPLPDEPMLTQVISGNRLMAHNHTVWTVETDHPSELLTALRDQCDDKGWRVGGGTPDPESGLSHFRATGPNNGRVLEAFRERPSWDRTADSGPERVIIRYLDRMTRQEMGPVFERWLDDDSVDPLTLITFERNMSSELRDRLWDKLAERTDLPLATELRVIRHLDGRGENDRARARFDGARLLALFAPREEREKVEELTEDLLGETAPTPSSPTDAQLEAIGAVRVAPDGSVSTEVGVGQTAKFYQRLPDRLVLLAATVERATIPEGTYTLAFADHSPGPMGGGNISSTPHHPASPWTSSVSFNSWNAHATEVGSERFRIDLQARMPE